MVTLRRRFWAALRPLSQWLARHRRWPPFGRLDPVALPGTAAGSRSTEAWSADSIQAYYARRFLVERGAASEGRLLRVGRCFADHGKRGAAVSWDLLEGWPTDSARVPAPNAAQQFAPRSFDRVVCLHELERCFDPAAALAELQRVVAAGGELLVITAGIATTPPGDEASEPVYWRFTGASLRRLLVESGFSASGLEIHSYGNVLAAAAALQGRAAETLAPAELDHDDADYQVVVAGRATLGDRPG